VARHLPGRKVVSIVDGNDSTRLTHADLQEMGFAVVLYAVTTLFAAARATAEALAHLKSAGTPAGGLEAMSYAEFSEVVDLAEAQAFGARVEP